METPETDQGPPVEEPASDVIESGDDTAAEQVDTVEESADTPVEAKDEESGEGDPYADLLSKEEFVPRKDYIHAQRKITEQGQNLSARDAEISQLRSEIAKMQLEAIGVEYDEMTEEQAAYQWEWREGT